MELVSFCPFVVFLSLSATEPTSRRAARISEEGTPGSRENSCAGGDDSKDSSIEKPVAPMADPEGKENATHDESPGSFPAASASASSSSRATPAASASSSAAPASASSSDAGAFECNICFDTASDPVVSLCGHLYWSASLSMSLIYVNERLYFL